MAEKKGAGGHTQTYDKSTGRYGETSSKDKISELENKYNSDYPAVTVPKYRKVKEKLKTFAGKEVGTYNYNTGKLVNLTDGYMVTFHQNEPDENGHYKSHYGRYTDDEYDKLTNDFARENNAEVFVGVFDDEPEISFKVKTFEQAEALMIKYNQDSLWDNKENELLKNKMRDKSKNPLQGE